MEDLIADFLSGGRGYGSGYGSGDGYGDGSGDGSGDGYGSGYGYGGGYGDGSGYGSGYGDGSGYGYGYGYGDGSGYGSGYGDGSGYGYGSGYGGGYGDGSGYGDSGINSYCGQRVYLIDTVPTIIDRVRKDVAKGRILDSDLTCTPCYIVKLNGFFAHGQTIQEATKSAIEKSFKEMPLESRIEAFVKAHEKGKAYPNTDFFDWHNKLTGSCRPGRDAFVRNHEIDMNGCSTVAEFIRLTENSYAGDVIRKLKKYY